MSNLETMIADARQRRVDEKLADLTAMVEAFHQAFGWCDEEMGIQWKIAQNFRPVGWLVFQGSTVELWLEGSYFRWFVNGKLYDRIVVPTDGENLKERARDNLLIALGGVFDEEKQRQSRRTITAN